jgi:hypothetical protein
MRRFLALVPSSYLDDAALMLASFEWLEAEANNDPTEPMPSTWLRKFEHLGNPLPPSAPSILVQRVEGRRRAHGTIDWGEFPRVLLAAACHLVCATGNRAGGCLALCEASAFAPRFVQHDVLLAEAVRTEVMAPC